MVVACSVGLDSERSTDSSSRVFSSLVIVVSRPGSMHPCGMLFDFDVTWLLRGDAFSGPIDKSHLSKLTVLNGFCRFNVTTISVVNTYSSSKFVETVVGIGSTVASVRYIQQA